MAVKGRRPQVDHYAVAEALRETPGAWDLVKVYATRYSAWNTRNRIRGGTDIPAYQGGGFDAYVAPMEDGDWALWAKYEGEPSG